MKIAFTTLGCKLNFAESSALGKALIERGHTRAKQGEEADICVINTCSVTDAADHKDRQMIHRIRRQHPHAILIVTGCYAQLKPDEIAHIEGVDYVLGQEEKFNLPAFVKRIEDAALQDGKAYRVKDAALQDGGAYRVMHGFTENYIKVSCPYDRAKVNTFERIIVPRPEWADIPTDIPE